MKPALFAAALAITIAPTAMAQTSESSICTVTYSVETETADGHDVGTSVIVLQALPMADVLFNAEAFNKVLDRISKDQEHGGPYTVQLDETRVCDGGAPFKAQGIEARGLTLAGANRASRVALQQAGQIVTRYEARQMRGAKVGWDHAKAKKVDRDDLGKRKK